MGIWKWMKHDLPGRITGARTLRAGCTPVFILCGLLAAAPLSPEASFGVQVTPGVWIPLGDTLLKTGYGASLSLDFFPVSFIDLFAQAEYVSVGLENVDPVPILDGSLGLGLIWRCSDRFSLRSDLTGGIYTTKREGKNQSGISAAARLSGNYHISPALTASVQAGLKQYAYEPEPFMNALTIGLGVSVNLKEAFAENARVSIETESLDPVFPVFYSWYDDNRFAVLKITNNERTAITDVTTSFYLEQYMGQPKVCTTTRSVNEGESFEVPLTAFFNESMLELKERVDTEAKIIVEYRCLGAKRRAEIPVVVPVYHRNAMSWEDDRRAAAFVSSKDPASLWFSKYVSSIVRDRFRPGVNQNVQYAMGVFEALNAYGLNYVIDPSSAYSDNAGSSASIDFLQYPYQTLMYRGGDCDDLSILFCSLLESGGIESAFITIPGHIYIAFASGMTEAEARAEFYAPDQLIYRDGQAWFPLEITLTKEGFSKAWRIGSKEWKDADARGTANLYPVREAWKLYRPVSVPGAASRFNLPDGEMTAQAFDASLDVYLERELRPRIHALLAEIERSDTSANRNRLGVLYGSHGMFDKATEQFAIAAARGDANSVVNLGNVAFMAQDYAGALKKYRQALETEPGNNLALLGAARCYYELEEFSRSDSLYAELGTRDAVLGRQYAYLGSFFETRGRAWSLSDRLATTSWSVAQSAPKIAAETRDPVGGAGDGAEDAALLTLAALPPDSPDSVMALLPRGCIPALVPETGIKRAKSGSREGEGGGDDDPDLPASGGLTSMMSLGRVTGDVLPLAERDEPETAARALPVEATAVSGETANIPQPAGASAQRAALLPETVPVEAKRPETSLSSDPGPAARVSAQNTGDSLPARQIPGAAPIPPVGVVPVQVNEPAVQPTTESPAPVLPHAASPDTLQPVANTGIAIAPSASTPRSSGSGSRAVIPAAVTPVAVVATPVASIPAKPSATPAMSVAIPVAKISAVSNTTSTSGAAPRADGANDSGAPRTSVAETAAPNEPALESRESGELSAAETAAEPEIYHSTSRAPIVAISAALAAVLAVGTAFVRKARPGRKFPKQRKPS